MLIDLLQNGASGFDLTGFARQLLLSLIPFLLALSAHEAAHGYVALRCGDPTAKMLGRVTLNPLRHIDPMGLLMLFAVGFGWAKPVPVNPRNFRHYRRDDLLVSLAGITANFCLFLLGCVLAFATVALAIAHAPQDMWYDGQNLLIALDAQNYLLPPDMAISMALYSFLGGSLITPALGVIPGYLYEMLCIFVQVNLVLALFNLLPAPPLDGYHVLNDLLLRRQLFAPEKVARVGQLLLLVLIMTGWWSDGMSWVLTHVYDGMGAAFTWLFQTLHII